MKRRLTRILAGAGVVMKPHVWWLLALAAVAAILFWRGLVSNQWIISKPGTDGTNYVYHTFSYIQEGLRQGEFRVWNPYMFCGTPVMEAFQYCLQYPIRWPFALLPVPLAINWLMFSHVLLAGAGMYGWVWFRARSAPGAFVAGVIYMLCGALMPHVTSGHFTLVYAQAWIPLVFWGIDGWCRQRRARWLALATGAATLQLLCGYPQLFYFTALLAGLYSVWTLAMSAEKMKTAAGLIIIYPLTALITAAVMAPGFLVAQEAVRAGGGGSEWAATASLQYKDLLLVFVPGFFGAPGNNAYWDTEHIHEMWVYSGLGGLLLACAGLCKISKGERIKFIVLMLLALVLALGAFTPLFGVLRAHVPMYSSFRGMGRWTIFFSLFVAMLAGTGMGKIASGEKIPRAMAWGFLGMGAAFLLIGLLLHGNSLDNVYHNLADTLTFKPWYRQNLPFADRQAVAQNTSVNALLFSGGLAAVLGLVVLLVKRRTWLAGLLIVITVADMMLFAAPLVQYFNRSEVDFSALKEVTKRFPPDDRNLLGWGLTAANVTLRTEGIWGYDPVIPKRYVELFATSQGIPVDHATSDMPIQRNSPIFKLLRARYAFVPTQQGLQLAELQPEQDVLPRFLVAGNYRVLAGRDEVLQTLAGPFFDFRREVILETKPDFPPQILAPENTINVITSSPSRWVVEVETSGPGILLMTDSFAKGWRARALPGSVQSNYDLQPADWAMRGIPLLKPGKHVIEIKYTPPGFLLGLGVTLATLAALALFAAPAVGRRMLKLDSPPDPG